MSGLAEILEANASLRESRVRLLALLEVKNSALVEKDSALEANQAELSAKERALAENQAELAAKERALAENQAQLSAKEQALAENQAELAAKERALAENQAKLDIATARLKDLEEQLARLLRKPTEPVSERYIPGQHLLPFDGDAPAPPPRKPEPEAEKPKKRTRGTPKRRKRDSLDHLDSRPVTCKAAEDSCRRCGRPLQVIGQAESFRVEWVPGHFVVHDVVRDKCACSHCPGEGVLTVPAPYALDRALCANGLLARVLVDKFSDHLPLNRQAKRMAREGFEVGSTTLASWVKGAGRLLGHIADQIHRELLTSPFLQGDDTGMPVQDAGNGSLRKGRLWAFTDQQQVSYHFTDTKEGTAPVDLLKGFTGDLLCVDGGGEFNQVVREQRLTRGGCWSHLRKRFFEARHAHPRMADLALTTIRDLFLIERDLWGRPPEEIRSERQRRSKPLVDGFFGWCEQLSPMTRPESTLGKALSYAINQRSRMEVHLEHGELPMHNNLSELMLRQAVVGRKSWLFARSEGGAMVAATMYTLVGTCQLQGVDPQAYLVDVLGRIQDHPTSRLGELTPGRWRALREGHTAV